MDLWMNGWAKCDISIQWNITQPQKEWSTDTSYWSNLHEPGRHYAKWTKPDTKDHIMYDSIYLKFPE